MAKCNQLEPLEVLQWLWENESALPKNPTDLLKRVGWVFAQRAGLCPNISDMGYGLVCEMFSDLTIHAGGARQAVSDDFAYREHPVGMYSTTSAYRASQKPGWHLAQVLQLYNYGELEGGEFVFTYTMPPPKGHVPLEPNPSPIAMTDTHWGEHRASVIWDSVCQRKLIFQKFSFDANMARFELRGVPLFLLEHEASTFLVLATSFDQPGAPQWELEFVQFGEPETEFVYGLYNARTRVASATETRTSDYRIFHAMRAFPLVEMPDWPPHYEVKFPYTGHKGLRVTHRLNTLLPDGGHANINPSDAYSNAMDLVRSMEWIAKLVSDPCHNVHMRRKQAELLNIHIGEALTQQLRRRLVRVARAFLLKSAELAERRRAGDPVRKCAACAVEAVKSQLALGIEGPDAKRQRV